jgi:hypothetical protein
MTYKTVPFIQAMRTEYYNYSATKLKMVRDLVDEYEAGQALEA